MREKFREHRRNARTWTREHKEDIGKVAKEVGGAMLEIFKTVYGVAKKV